MPGDILTITFNPCIDKSTTIGALVPERKLKCSAPTFEPGGGGINVARAIKLLGGNATAIFPVGGYTGKFLQTLVQNEGIKSRVVETEKHTRENMIVCDLSTNQQYRFGMPGQEMLQTEWEQCLQLVEKNFSEYIVASGSIPPGVPVDIFARVARIAKQNNRKLIVDTSGDALSAALDEGVYLIKPNLGELSKLAGKDELAVQEIENVAVDLIKKTGCSIIVVSMGPAGAILITSSEVFKVVAPPVKRKSTVGAGDSMVAGIVFSLANNKSLKEAICFGVACGTAATINPGNQLCRPADVKKLYLDIIALQFN